MPELPLAGCGIAITRPLDQAQPLAELIRQNGGTPILFPLLAITALDDYAACDAAIALLGTANWAIFISSNAVQNGMTRVLRHYPVLPENLHFAAIGPDTAAALQQFGISHVLIPQGRYDSESLLALPQLQQLEGQRIVIFRGVGGRELLAKILAERGAEVVLAECYRRSNPQTHAGELTRLWQNKQVHAVVVTSSEAMRNLLAIGDASNWLEQSLLCVNHPRIAELAAQHGLRVAVAKTPGDTGLLQCLIQHCQNRSP
jgi:uroporphyrinogen-III synthase